MEKTYIVSYKTKIADTICVKDSITGETLSSVMVEHIDNTKTYYNGLVGDLASNGCECVGIWDLSTRRDCRRKGYARKVMEYAVRKYKDCNIVLIAKPYVRFCDDITLERLMKFYESVGFEAHKILTDRAIMKMVNCI